MDGHNESNKPWLVASKHQSGKQKQYPTVKVVNLPSPIHLGCDLHYHQEDFPVGRLIGLIAMSRCSWVAAPSSADATAAGDTGYRKLLLKPIRSNLSTSKLATKDKRPDKNDRAQVLRSELQLVGDINFKIFKNAPKGGKSVPQWRDHQQQQQQQNQQHNNLTSHIQIHEPLKPLGHRASVISKSQPTKTGSVLLERLRNENTHGSAIKAIDMFLNSCENAIIIEKKWTRDVAIKLGEPIVHARGLMCAASQVREPVDPPISVYSPRWSAHERNLLTTIRGSNGDRKLVDIDEAVLAAERYIRSSETKPNDGYLVTSEDLSNIFGCVKDVAKSGGLLPATFRSHWPSSGNYRLGKVIQWQVKPAFGLGVTR
ncbi:MAG: hypothetical protein Q9184_002230 [Pyrenodesmia sp. 2 TL-2023]